MSLSELLGSVIQAGMTASTSDRLRNSLAGGSADSGGLLENLASMLGGAGSGSGGLLDNLSSMLGGASGGGLGGLLGSVLGEAEQAVGGRDNLALGGLGALAGALLGGGGKSMGGAIGGGLLALLGAMAFRALRAAGAETADVPIGLMEPKTDADRRRLEEHAELILKAMINAAKADGQIDQGEVQRIIGKLQEDGIDQNEQQFIIMEMQKPMQTERLIAAARGRREVAAEIYAASLLAIEVDTPAEKEYLNQLEAGLGLTSEVTQQIRGFTGV
ncbi:MAG: tellurite resistance TerB family protein [Deltaproteobacteria bacterium]|nr:tellurite resistance TerB family protein [Deltaproteobacteria bacterium]